MVIERAGFVMFVGRPNAGKSTLMNALVGQKVAITSSKPQTTRRIIRGVITTDTAQIVVVDSPGMHRPRTLLGQRLNEQVKETLADVDVICFCLPADQKIGPGDRFIADQLCALGKKPVIAVLTKTDTVSQAELFVRLQELAELGVESVSVGGKKSRLASEAARQSDSSEAVESRWSEIVPLSAQQNFQVDILKDVVTQYLPESPQLYDAQTITDEPERILVAEFIREAALEEVRDELPHSLYVVVDEVLDRENARPDRPVKEVYVSVYVERSSQKSIIIGKAGQRLKQIGSQARPKIEEILGSRVYLDIRVKVAKEWQRDPKMLKRFGF